MTASEEQWNRKQTVLSPSSSGVAVLGFVSFGEVSQGSQLAIGNGFR
jgi:hypothetical protein